MLDPNVSRLLFAVSVMQAAALIYQIVDMANTPNPMKLIQILVSSFYVFSFSAAGFFNLVPKE